MDADESFLLGSSLEDATGVSLTKEMARGVKGLFANMPDNSAELDLQLLDTTVELLLGWCKATQSREKESSKEGFLELEDGKREVMKTYGRKLSKRCILQ